MDQRVIIFEALAPSKCKLALFTKFLLSLINSNTSANRIKRNVKNFDVLIMLKHRGYIQSTFSKYFIKVKEETKQVSTIVNYAAKGWSTIICQLVFAQVQNF